MKKTAFRVIATALCVILCSQAFESYADPSIDEIKDERDETQENLDEVTATLEELAAEQNEVIDEIEQVNEALVTVMTEVEVIRQAVVDKEAEIAQATERYEEAVATANEQYEAMKIRIQYMYEAGEPDYLTMLMQAGSFSEVLTKADYVQDLYDYDRNMLAEYQRTIEQVEELRIALEAEQEELLALQADYEEEQAYMESVILELQALSDDYAAQIADAEALAASYAQKIEEQNAEIARLEEEARRAAEEAARRAAEEAARRAAQDSVAASADSGRITTTNSVTYDVSSIYAANGGDLGKSIAVFACQFIGNPYVPGGTSLTNGADCSGFVFSVYKEFGYTVPRTSYSLRSAGTEVSYENAQPGDIICYPGHVAIYIGNGLIVHASSVRTGIKISNAQYRGILTVRRLI
ncbi:MAG: C40 family peptidase [Lachnospiraceae bacterium]|nr:C40 family peptidase [Lachnospiraceae bacterium]